MKNLFVNRLGLIVLTSMSLVCSSFADSVDRTSASAAATQVQGPQQVIVTNTAAAPIPVALAGPQYFQMTQTVSCAGCTDLNFTFNVPAGKTMLVRSVNILAGSYNALDVFG